MVVLPRKRSSETSSPPRLEVATARRIVMNFDTESIDGYAIPVDPMDLLQCDSCQ